MFTNQKILGFILLMFVIGTAVYFTYTKFKQDVSSATVESSPSPSPASLEFILGQTSAPIVQEQQKTQQKVQQPTQPQQTPRPYFANKNVGKFPGVLTEESLKNKKVVIQTNKGTLEIEIFTDTPLASSNFLLLSDGGFYDGLKFHRVEDWVVQGGDPLGNGSGGPGYVFQDEAVSRAYTKGIVAMANAGPNTNGSQFFILKTDYPLPPNYTIFGQVISGMDVVLNLKKGDVMQQVTIQVLQ